MGTGITNSGLAGVAALIQAGVTYLANGSGSTAFAAAQTTLITENTTGNCARAAGTMSRVTTTVTNDTCQATKTWTASGAVTIREAGLFDTAVTGGIMLYRGVLAADKVLASGDSYALTVKIQVS